MTQSELTESCEARNSPGRERNGSPIGLLNPITWTRSSTEKPRLTALSPPRKPRESVEPLGRYLELRPSIPRAPLKAHPRWQRQMHHAAEQPARRCTRLGCKLGSAGLERRAVPTRANDREEDGVALTLPIWQFAVLSIRLISSPARSCLGRGLRTQTTYNSTKPVRRGAGWRPIGTRVAVRERPANRRRAIDGDDLAEGRGECNRQRCGISCFDSHG